MGSISRRHGLVAYDGLPDRSESRTGMSCYDVYVDFEHAATNEPNGRGRRGRFFVELQARLAVPVLLVGVGGGIAGAAYIGALNVLTRTLGPGSHTVVVQAAILVAVGVAITVISRLLGDSGNVELLVDNIHVLGGAEDVRKLRSLGADIERVKEGIAASEAA